MTTSAPTELSVAPQPASFDREEFIASYFRQMFSLPDSMIYYITKNPKSSKCYQKMIQACKHFFIKNPILVIHCLHISDDGWKVCSGATTCIRGPTTQKSHITTEKLVGCKIWSEFRFIVDPTSSNTVADLFPKVYQCDALNVGMINQRLSFEKFLFYSKNVRGLNLISSYIYSETDSEISIETIIANLPDIFSLSHRFHPSSKKMSKDTVNKLLHIPHFKNLTSLMFWGISEDFDMDTFYDYYKKNKHMKECIIRYEEMPSPDYAEKLDRIIDEILADKSRASIPPEICYPGQNMEKLETLMDLRESYES